MRCILHWCYTFCTGVTLFALVLHLNCTALSQSESSNFFMYIIMIVTLNKSGFHTHKLNGSEDAHITRISTLALTVKELKILLLRPVEFYGNLVTDQ